MLKSALFGILILILAVFLKSWGSRFQESPYKDALSSLEEIRVRAYSKSGIEWVVKGQSLTAKGQKVELKNAELYYSDNILTSQRAVFNRQTGDGVLYQGVNLKSQDLEFSTDSSFINMKEGLIWGNGEVKLRLANAKITGEGFKIHTDSETINIFKVKTSIE
ncbi:MAG: LPS export ABC transporter periplasmic protein LptC [Aquificaceae bacterium]|nr:LPS export ABC transporter periplasmic protein LptC [Aquificaceae bacterium]MDW8237018.1 LPS export ABC transporter periplasmic protein LptC [Aquificaceae bacterium]